MAKEKEPKKENFFMRLFKGKDKIAFFRNKESVAEFTEKEKIKAEVLIEAAQKMMREKRGTINDTVATYEGDDREVYLYDFINEYRNGFGGGGNFVIAGRSAVGGVTGVSANFDGDSDIAFSAPDSNVSGGNMTLAVDDNVEKLPKKRYKPKEVFGELERTPSKVDLENLDDKILVMKMKVNFIRKNEYAKKEVIDMVTRLENRKKYEEHKEFFEKFDNTTTQKINDLINKYELVLRPSDLFIPSFPDEAIKTMSEFTETVQKICGKKPVYYVIAEAEKFKEESERNDPILLAQSPFGIYWYILGAWDEELVLLSEL